MTVPLAAKSSLCYRASTTGSRFGGNQRIRRLAVAVFVLHRAARSPFETWMVAKRIALKLERALDLDTIP
jgi:hypothetical protein